MFPRDAVPAVVVGSSMVSRDRCDFLIVGGGSESMKVHGVEGVRVVDASAMPHITNGSIYAPVIMLAEKAADLILGNTPLAPDPASWYRHER